MTEKLKDKITKTDAEWRQQLTPEQYQVARASGTERAFTGQYWNKHDDGTYHCVCCGALLFWLRKQKFDSGNRMAGKLLFAAADRKNIAEITDTSYGMARTEARCARCDAHLGHVFPDGPGPDRAALLHEFSLARLQTQEVSELQKRSKQIKENDGAPARPCPAGRARRPSLHRCSLNSNLEFGDFSTRNLRVARSRSHRLRCFLLVLSPGPAFSDLSFRGCALRPHP